MTTDQPPYVDRVDGEVVVDSTAEEPMIPAQREAPAVRPAAPKGSEQKPILAPWMKDRAGFTGKVRDVSKRAAHTVGWHLWQVLPNAPSRAVVCPTRALEGHQEYLEVGVRC